MNGTTAQRTQFLILANLAILIPGVSIRFGRAAVVLADAKPARVSASATNGELRLAWQGDESIDIAVSKQRGVFQTPLRIKVNDRSVSVGGRYVRINELTDGFTVESTDGGIRDSRQFQKQSYLDVFPKINMLMPDTNSGDVLLA
jgi:hypothetical protein